MPVPANAISDYTMNSSEEQELLWEKVMRCDALTDAEIGKL
jgi:hypothetical protein